MKRAVAGAILGVALAAIPAGAYHDRGCGGGINFGGGNLAAHNWMNACTPAGNLYFFGTFGPITSGDTGGMCGYLVFDSEGPVDMYAGLAGDMQGGRPRPILVGPTSGDWAPSHPGGPSCRVPLPN